jgi:hypothetical protein
MFVDAINNSTQTAPYSSHNDPRMPPTTVSLKGSMRTRIPASVSGYSPARRAWTEARSARAWSSVAPDLRRPMPVYHCSCLSRAAFRPGGPSTG